MRSAHPAGVFPVGAIVISMRPYDHQPTSAVGDYPLKGSRQLAAILIAGHSAVAGLLLYLDLAIEWKVAALALILTSLLLEIRVAFRLNANAVTMLRIAGDNVLSAQTRRGNWHVCEVLGSTYVTAFLTVLNLRANGERRIRNVVILPDSAGAEDYRRLRVWLRWRPQAGRD